MTGWLRCNVRAVVLVGLVTAVLAGLVVFGVKRSGQPARIMTVLTPAPTPEPTATPGPLRVYVTGAVRQPGVYAVAAGSIVDDAVRAAGGAGSDADLERINLASPLADGQQVHVPRQGEENPPAGSRSQPVAGKININTAGLEALETLPGIGPALAQRIIDYRQAHGPFIHIEDIMDVNQVGQATFDEIRELITTE